MNVRKYYVYALLLTAFLLFATCPGAVAQTESFYAAGGTVDTTSSPNYNGFAAWAKPLNQSGTYTTTTYRVFSKSWQPFEVTTSIAQGVAQRVWTHTLLLVNRPIQVEAYLCGDVGVATGGENVGYSASVCGLGTAMFTSHWGALVRGAGEKSSLVNGRGTFSFGLVYRR